MTEAIQAELVEPQNQPEQKAPLQRQQHTIEQPQQEQKAIAKQQVNFDVPDVRYHGFTLREVDTIKETAVKDQGLTSQELIQFCYLAKAYQLDPFAKEIWGIKTKSMLSIEASASGWRKIIRRQENFKRMVLNPWYAEDDIEFDHLNGKITKHIQKGTFQGDPVGAYCYVEYKDGSTNLSIALWEEYGQPAVKNGKFGDYDTPWKYKQEMIKNKASAIFGRTYFGVSGLYAQGEGRETTELALTNSEQYMPPKQLKGKDAKAALRRKKKRK